jgi:hypothetical protein
MVRSHLAPSSFLTSVGADNEVFTLLELTSAITKHHHDPCPNPLSVTDSTPTMSNPPPLPNQMLAAEILIPPPNSFYPTPLVYVSNRNDPSPQGDTIAIFSDTLQLIAEVRTGLNHLRGMAFGGPNDKWLVAGGVNGGGVKIFERIDGGRGLQLVASLEGVESPTGFLWL